MASDSGGCRRPFGEITSGFGLVATPEGAGAVPVLRQQPIWVNGANSAQVSKSVRDPVDDALRVYQNKGRGYRTVYWDPVLRDGIVPGGLT